MKKTFSISEAISFGWRTFKSNWKFWIVASLITGMATGSSSLPGVGNLNRSSSTQTSSITKTVGRDLPYPKEPIIYDKVLGASTAVQKLPMSDKGQSSNSMFILIPFVIITVVGFVAVGVIGILVSTALRMGYVNLTLDSVRNKQVYYKTILNQMSLKKAWRFLIANFLVTLNIIVGLILFIIPGILYALKYYFVSYLIVDKDMKPREAMKESGRLTKGVRFKLVSLTVVYFLIAILGFLVFGVGVIPASIVISIANAYIFNKLLEQSEPAVVPPSPIIPDVPAIETPLPPSIEVPSINSGNLLAENQTLNESSSIKTEN
ncbi:hypothetical protein KA062_02130 [Patescibacteria group bacterium]|nr:hypothetical protein [Patescibacteria group bacterium]